MTDRELLEVAAKAAGAKWIDDEMFGCGWALDDCWWNPLTDDGDALRLAVKLNLSVRYDCCDEGIEVRVEGEWDNAPSPVFETFESEGDIATRRAIVKAAAEIGKGMK